MSELKCTTGYGATFNYCPDANCEFHKQMAAPSDKPSWWDQLNEAAKEQREFWLDQHGARVVYEYAKAERDELLQKFHSSRVIGENALAEKYKLERDELKSENGLQKDALERQLLNIQELKAANLRETCYAGDMKAERDDLVKAQAIRASEIRKLRSAIVRIEKLSQRDESDFPFGTLININDLCNDLIKDWSE